MRQTPPSTSTQTLPVKNGSHVSRSRIGPSENLTNDFPPSSLTARPTAFRKGTVTPRFQPT